MQTRLIQVREHSRMPRMHVEGFFAAPASIETRLLKILLCNKAAYLKEEVRVCCRFADAVNGDRWHDQLDVPG
jgi:hypothetical protein